MNSNPKGTIVKGIASDIDENNALIVIDKSINGLLKITEISRDNLNDVRTVIKSGDTIEAKIIGFDKKNRTVKLSVKAKERNRRKGSTRII